MFAGVLVVVSAAAYFLGRGDLPEPRVVQFPLPPPAGTVYHLDRGNPGPVAVSPDGSMLVFSARDRSQVFSAGRNVFENVPLYLKRLDAADSQPSASA